MNSDVTQENFTYAQAPYKFEGGTLNISGIIGWGAAIDYINKIGMQNITKRIVELKKYADAMWYAIGLDPNVNRAYEGIMNDPNMQIAAGDKVYRPHPGVGNLRPYNESGHPAGGAFTMHTFA